MLHGSVWIHLEPELAASACRRMSTDLPAPTILRLWPGAAPGDQPGIGPERDEAKGGITRTFDVTAPRIAVYRPAAGTANGAAVVICPGGGYTILAKDLEGEEVAARFLGAGVTAIILTYRVPERAGRQRWEAPLEDAQRALGLVRANAAAWGIDPARIGILGFSAGGHLAATASNQSASRRYAAIDASDALPCRPDFSVLIYPAFLVEGMVLNPEIAVSAATPPAFLAMTGDDPHHAEGCVAYWLALRQAKVPSELHVYETGGHGYGLRPAAGPCAGWAERCIDWLRHRGLLGAR